MIKIDDKEYRNLEEQVEKNKSDIEYLATSGQALNTFGLKVVQQFATVAEFEQWSAEAEKEYGDAILIGVEEPYDMKVWTRANTTHPNDYWIDLGDFPVAGPQGPQGTRGPQGIQGPSGQSTRWYYSNSAPQATAGYNVGDIHLNATNGNIYMLTGSATNKVWVYVSNIKGPQGIQGNQGIRGEQGPQGIQGPQGERGDVGGFINIRGIVASTSLLPTPESLQDLTVAYLVGTTRENYHLYIQIGQTSATALWNDMGPLNVATYVTVNGQFVNVWDADTKVNKFTGTGSRLYSSSNGVDGTVTFASTANANTVAYRTTGGRLNVGDPVADTNAANKKYVDNAIAAIPQGGGTQLYVHNITTSGGSSYRVLSLTDIPYGSGMYMPTTIGNDWGALYFIDNDWAYIVWRPIIRDNTDNVAYYMMAALGGGGVYTYECGADTIYDDFVTTY